MADDSLTMRFDLQTINHLGLRMYSTLPPALAEIISNSYDADAQNVVITLSEENGVPNEIKIEDDGIGMSFDEIKDNFLVIGRDRRSDGDLPTAKLNRLPTGKKGLGKLALFGLAKTITVSTKQNNKLNEFVLDWDELMKSKSAYHPNVTKTNVITNDEDGTVITLAGLKRKTSFNIQALASSLSKIFIFDDNFNIIVASPKGDKVSIDNKMKYETLEKEFSWPLDSSFLIPKESEYFTKLEGVLLTSEKPIAPSSGLRGVTLFSRGKLVNAPEFFSSSTSSHFYQYLTGWISVDFIDLLPDDVISTNRQSINWEHPEMERLRDFLSGIMSQVKNAWRKKRREKKDQSLKDKTGINTLAWTSTMPGDVRDNTLLIIEALSGEDALEKFTPVIKALHEIVPEYPLLHWRHLHTSVQEKSKKYYVKEDYYTAFLEAIKKYVNSTRDKSKSVQTEDYSMMGKVFAEAEKGLLDVTANYIKPDGGDFTALTKKTMQSGQQHLSQGVIAGGRNPLSHEEVEDLKMSDLFSESDCLDLLSLLSHLFKRLDNAKKKTST